MVENSYFLLVCFILIFILVYIYLNFNSLISTFYSWRTSSRIIVFESDDWGRETLNQIKLKELSVNLKTNGYPDLSVDSRELKWLTDTLESGADLEKLYSILEKHTDSRGRHPVFTANIVVSNPDYDAILNNNFSSYIPLKPSDSLIEKWKEGIKRGIFFPQYHGYAHFNFLSWLRDLRNNDNFLKRAFEFKILPIYSLEVGGKKYNHRSEYIDLSSCPSKIISFDKQKDIVGNGTNIFNRIFDYKSTSTIAPGYNWDETTEKTWIFFNIKYIQSGNYHVVGRDKFGKEIIKSSFLGQRNNFGQVYLIRNCEFEPFTGKTKTVEDTLKRMKSIFNKDYPVIINTHRINYISGADVRLRDLNLIQLDILLEQVKKEFPDVIYLTSAELGELIETSSFHDFITGEVVTIYNPWFVHFRWLFKSRKFYLVYFVAILIIFITIKIIR